MAISDGQPVNAAASNAAWMSRTTDTSTAGVVDLNNTTDVDSGAQVPNLQQRVNELQTQTGQVDGDANNLVYASNNALVNGENHKQNLGNLDSRVLNSIQDVDVPTPSNGDVLTFNNVSGNWEAAAGGGGGAVTSVFTRTGAVVAVSGDYDADQIDETASRVFVTPAEKTAIGTNSAKVSADGSVSTHSDVDVSLASDGEFLSRVGGIWQGVAAPSGGGFSAISTETSSFAPADKNCYIVDVSGGAISVNLPAPSSLFQFTIKVIGDAATNNVTLNRNAAEEIDAVAANLIIDNGLGAYNVISDGTDWFLI